MTPEEIDQANAEFRQWWLPVLTHGRIPNPNPRWRHVHERPQRQGGAPLTEAGQ